MSKITYLSLYGLKVYHKKLMEYINTLIINRAFEYTNCPNCAAVITGPRCEFCGTIFKTDWSEDNA